MSFAMLVTVHHFRVWDEKARRFIVPPLKGTAERIKLAKGQIVKGTAEEVDQSAIDTKGRYRPPGPGPFEPGR